ncbi:MAG: TolC family protein, partial [Muribaculaceae bacterium]|nr:TolC family protein [Muribaculaceae bacterium]
VYARRHDIRALELGEKITGQQKNVALSSMLPNVALVGAYSFSSPNVFNGFKNRVNGGFSVGVGVNIPIVHWGGNYNKYRAARSQQTVMELQLDEAKEKVELQVTQAAYKAQEALKTYNMTLTNMAKADENLRSASLGFREAVLTADDVMKAQTAWLQANSEKIDAAIEVHLCDVYLSKVLGTLATDTVNDK